MAEDNLEKPEIPAQPKCPHCGSQPMTLGVKELTFPNGIVILMVWCANPDCMTVLSASYRGNALPRIMTPHPRA